jgi:hypothetical protein
VLDARAIPAWRSDLVGVTFGRSMASRADARGAMRSPPFGFGLFRSTLFHALGQVHRGADERQVTEALRKVAQLFTRCWIDAANLRAPWQELRSAEAAVTLADAQPGEYLRGAQAIVPTSTPCKECKRHETDHAKQEQATHRGYIDDRRR